MAHIKRFEEFIITESLTPEIPNESSSDESGKPQRKKFVPFNKGRKASEYLTPEQIEKMKLTQFPKGHIPFNKDKKREDYLTPEQIELSKATEFKAGVHTMQNSASWKGGIQKSKRDGAFINTGTNERKRIARYNYEKEHGEIPQGWIIYHIDQDKDNDHIDNLIAVPRSVLMRLNANRMNSNYHEIKTAVDNYLTNTSNQ